MNLAGVTLDARKNNLTRSLHLRSLYTFEITLRRLAPTARCISSWWSSKQYRRIKCLLSGFLDKSRPPAISQGNQWRISDRHSECKIQASILPSLLAHQRFYCRGSSKMDGFAQIGPCCSTCEKIGPREVPQWRALWRKTLTKSDWLTTVRVAKFHAWTHAYG